MNSQTQKINSRQIYGKPYKGILAVILSFVLSLFSSTVTSNQSLDLNALFKPERSLLNAESQGRVTIYDGLTNKEVEKAMDEQFDRIEHMMFIRIRYVKADGEEFVDDEC